MIDTRKRWSWSARVTLYFCSGVWLAATMTYGVFLLGSDERSFSSPGLARHLPYRQGDWIGFDQPLADTPDALQQTIRILNYDEIVYRVYRNGRTEIGVYVAYWSEGKMAVRDIASHVPDICWGFAGWSLLENRVPFSLRLPGGNPIPCEYRVFRSPQGSVHVVYWHVLDGAVISHGSGSGVSKFGIFSDVLRYGARIRGAQCFVRVTSNRDLEKLMTDPDVLRLLEIVVHRSSTTM